MKPVTIDYIKKLKEKGEPFATLTAYDFVSAQILNEAKIPLILVGDSASMMVGLWLQHNNSNFNGRNVINSKGRF